MVLVTDGTKGTGLGTALAFARHGAKIVLSHKGGSVDATQLTDPFRALDAPAPLIVEADISRSDDTQVLFETIRDHCGKVDALISNAPAAVAVRSLEDLTERAFLNSMRASAWPTVEQMLAAKRVLGKFPGYVMVMSSDVPDWGTAAVETIARYLAYALRDSTRVNVIRSRPIDTSIEAVANVAFALCSGMFDAMTGQVVMVGGTTAECSTR